jgi:hypothetical protein
VDGFFVFVPPENISVVISSYPSADLGIGRILVRDDLKELAGVERTLTLRLACSLMGRGFILGRLFTPTATKTY